MDETLRAALASFVAAEGWRWMPGMLVFDALGNRHRLVDGQLDVALQSIVGLHGFALPDTDDPATLGCIEHGLLPKHWPGCHIQTHWTPCGMGSVYIHDVDGKELFAVEQVPKAEALLAALLASSEREDQR